MRTTVCPQRRLLIATRLRPLLVDYRQRQSNSWWSYKTKVHHFWSFSRLTIDCNSLWRYEIPAHIDHYLGIDWSQSVTDLRDHQKRPSTIVWFKHQLTPSNQSFNATTRANSLRSYKAIIHIIYHHSRSSPTPTGYKSGEDHSSFRSVVISGTVIHTIDLHRTIQLESIHY